MLSIQRTGRMSDVINEIRDIPARVIPYATSTALTRVASKGRSEIIAAMPRVFDRPTPYALRGTSVVPATVKTLTARVQVNNSVTNNGVPAENFLFPEVYGGPRKEKRFERTLRYSGILTPGHSVIPGQGAPLDAYGNIRASELQRIFTAINSSFYKYQNKSASSRSRKNAKNAPYFAVGTGTSIFVGGEHRFVKSRLQPGVYRREGKGIKPVLIFTKATPRYRKRLDFEGIAEKTAETEFRPEFLRALQSINARWST